MSHSLCKFSMYTLPYFKDCYDTNCKINILKFWLNQRTQYIEYVDHIKVIGMKYIIPDNIYPGEECNPSFDFLINESC